MPRLVLVNGRDPVTLCMTSEPVTLVPGVPQDVPQGYWDVLTNRALTAPYVIIDAPDEAPILELADEQPGLVPGEEQAPAEPTLEPTPDPDPEAPKPRTRKPKEA